jgi:hypothetical protein
VNGFVQFTVPGDREKRSAFGSQTSSAGKDENSVIFIRKQMPEFEKLRAAVETALVQGAQATTPQQFGPSIGDQITQLAALRDQGLLTSEEFAAKKADLLSRM